MHATRGGASSSNGSSARVSHLGPRRIAQSPGHGVSRESIPRELTLEVGRARSRPITQLSHHGICIPVFVARPSLAVPFLSLNALPLTSLQAPSAPSCPATAPVRACVCMGALNTFGPDGLWHRLLLARARQHSVGRVAQHAQLAEHRVLRSCTAPSKQETRKAEWRRRVRKRRGGRVQRAIGAEWKQLLVPHVRQETQSHRARRAWNAKSEHDEKWKHQRLMATPMDCQQT
eukprot:6188347-Pleurochrysis_carterae.AAC.1